MIRAFVKVEPTPPRLIYSSSHSLSHVFVLYQVLSHFQHVPQTEGVPPHLHILNFNNSPHVQTHTWAKTHLQSPPRFHAPPLHPSFLHEGPGPKAAASPRCRDRSGSGPSTSRCPPPPTSRPPRSCAAAPIGRRRWGRRAFWRKGFFL